MSIFLLQALQYTLTLMIVFALAIYPMTIIAMVRGARRRADVRDCKVRNIPERWKAGRY